MPMYDRVCDSCAHVTVDCYEPINTPDPQCECGGVAKRGFVGRASSVIGDDLPGGYVVEHGLTHEDGTPQKFYSKSEMRREAARRGLVNWVEHRPGPGTDKSPFTRPWF